jgi:hypothetical protein
MRKLFEIKLCDLKENDEENFKSMKRNNRSKEI